MSHRAINICISNYYVVARFLKLGQKFDGSLILVFGKRKLES